MVDIDDEPAGFETNVAAGAYTQGEPGDAPVVTSPVIEMVNFFKSLLGGKPKAAPAPRSVAPPKQASPAPVHKAAPAQTASKPTVAVPAAPKLEEVTVPVSGALATVVIRNEFYRDGFRNMIKIAIAQAVIIIVLILSFISYMNATEPQDHYFATTADGRIMRLVPLNLPNMNTSALMSWVAQASTEVMTFGFHDYQRRMQQSSRHFTRRGWETFTSALQKSRIIDAVEAAQQVVTAQQISAPVLIQEGVFNGKYRWVVDIPLTVSYKSGAASRADKLKVRLVIDRVPSLENPNGVGIEQWIAMAE